MNKKKFLINNKIVILFLFVICGVLPSLFIKADFFLHRYDYLEIKNLEDAIYNDCKMTSNGIEIYGSDPYLILGGFDINLNCVELIWNDQIELNNVQIFYDEGTGFCEQNSIIVSKMSSGEIIKINAHQPIKTIRLDFDADSVNSPIKLQAMRLNVRWSMEFSDKFLGGCSLLIILSLFISWINMNCKCVSVKELVSLLVGEVGALIASYGFVRIHGNIYFLIYGCIVICLTIFLSQLIYYENEKKILLAFLFFVFFTLLFWICTIPYNGAPDEAMRYDIVNYIVKFHKIPLGEEIEIRNGLYGFSYAFTPINIYIIDAVFVIIGSFFTSDFNILLVVARIPNVLLALGTLVFTYGIAKEKLSGRAKWIFISGAMMLPQLIFLFSYVNCDGIAIFSFVWIVYYTIRAENKGWPLKECLMLGVGIGICLLSYYNAYCIILTTVIYCVASVLTDSTIDNKFSFILQRTIWVFIPAFLYAGWWFIRNSIHHNGDFLGIATSRKYGELYGMEGYKPSQRSTPYNKGVSLHYMLFDMKWLEGCAKSFVAVFGWLNIAMPDVYYQVYYGSIIVVIIIACGRFVNKYFSKYEKGNLCNQLKISSFGLYLLANAIISFALAIYYSYFNDFQAQGRYFILAVFSIIYFVSKCLEFDLKSVHNTLELKIKKCLQLFFVIYFLVMFECAFIFVMIQYYF